MSCKCGHGHGPMPHPSHGPGHDCNFISHAFDPNPPAFYGTWNHLYGHDATNRVSVCQPGVQSGLYRKNGPLNCPCGCATMYTLTGVTTKARVVLDVTLTYTVSDLNKTITISPGEMYTFDYLEDGEMKNCSGKVTNIYKVEQLEENPNLYKIRVDCSTNYNNNVVVFKTDQIRGVQKYYQYAMEDSEITNGYHEGGTTIAQLIRDAVVVDAELDAEKNVLKGTIVYGILESGMTVDGVVIGTNKSGHDILLTNAQSVGGEISSGMLLNGIVRSGDIDGETDEATGIVTKATIKGLIANVVILNTNVAGVRVPSGKGTVVDPTIDDGILYNATVSGDIVTTGGVTVGNITTNGTTKGGTAEGGVAYGTIDGKQYSIEGGRTTGDLTTTGAVVVGGTIVGGTKVGNVIYNATVTGGVASNGITTGGTTTMDVSVKAYKNGYGARLKYGSVSEVTGRIGKIIHDNPTYNQLEAEMLKENRWGMNTKDLILATDRFGRGELYTNFGRADMEYIGQHPPRQHRG